MQTIISKEAFQKLHDWFILEHDAPAIGMVGSFLKNTLSDNGGVAKGICKLHQSDGHICDVVETHNIIKTAAGISAKGVALDPDPCGSINFWSYPAKEGHAPAYLDLLEMALWIAFGKRSREIP